MEWTNHRDTPLNLVDFANGRIGLSLPVPDLGVSGI
jgi:hypothetical protein